MTRRPTLFAIAGMALLIAGGVVFALGQSASSKASDDLAVAKTKLSEQRKATAGSKERRDEIQAALVELQKRASELLTTADQVAAFDAEVVSAAQAQQQAGVAEQLGTYNSAVDRGNAALNSLNAVIDTASQQVDAFTKALSAFG
jgi:hypothetical protein